MTLPLDDPRMAQLLTDMVDRRVRAAIDGMARIRYGTVSAVDPTSLSASLLLGGSLTPSPGFVYEAGAVPAVGDRVRAVNRGADRYIEANLTGAGAGPRGVLGRATRTTIATINSASDIEALAVTVTVAAARWLRVTYRTYRITTNTPVTDEFVVGLQMDGVNFYERSVQRGSTAFYDGQEFVAYIESGAAGSKTFRAIGRRTVGTTAALVLRGSTGQGNESWIMVEDVGAA